MNVSGVGSAMAASHMQHVASPQKAAATNKEAETAAEEATESPSAEANESSGSLGSKINTFA